jgi:transposase
MEVLDYPERLRIMAALKKYPPELKGRAVRLVRAAREDTGGGRGASARIGQQRRIPADTLRKWVLRAEIDSGVRTETTTEDAARLLALERENRERRRANAILRSAAAFFAAELDRLSADDHLHRHEQARLRGRADL